MKKLFFAGIAAIAAAALAFSAAACSKDKFEPPAQPERQVVEIGSDFSFPVLIGTYKDESVEASVSVSFGGSAVETSADGFYVDKIGEYTLTYTFVYAENKTYTMTQTVVGQDTVAPTVIVGATEGKYDFGATVELPEITVADRSGESIQPEVSVRIGAPDSEKTAKVENGVFKIESYETHYIVAEARDSSGNVGTGTETIVVRQEGEIEFFNSKSYTLKNYLTDNTMLDFNTDEKFIFEGSGSAHVTNFSTGVYPGFILRSVNGTMYKGAQSAVMWVYNNSAKTVNIDVVICEAKPEGGIKEVATIATFKAFPGIWTQMTLDSSALAKIGDEQFLKLFMPQVINPETYNSLDVYFDAFKIYTAEKPLAFSVEPQDIMLNCEDMEKVKTLSPADVTGIDDFSALQAYIVDTESGKSTAAEVTSDGVYIPAVVGKYTLRYFYKNGADGVTADQNVVLYDDETPVPTQKTYGVEDFESMIDITGEEYFYHTNVAQYDKFYLDDVNGNVLRIRNGTWSAATFHQLKPFVAEQMSAGDVLKFDVRMEKLDGAANYCMSVLAFNKGDVDIDPNKHWWLQDVTNFGEWNTITLSGAAAQSVIDNGGFGIFLLINKEGGGNLYEFTAYIDNIRIEKAAQTFDNSVTLQESLNTVFPGAKNVEVKSVKDENGADIAFAEGKFTASGKYAVEVFVTAQGYNGRAFMLEYNVTV